MNWIEWTIAILRLLLAVGGIGVGFNISKHYRRGEYQQSIYGMLILIFIVLCIK